MKTQYKPIAMRCTQEQFDTIKDRIDLPIDIVHNFKDFPYLINYKNVVSNLFRPHTIVEREIIESFDAEYFLDCCGREKTEEEEIFKGFEMQVRWQRNNERNNEWEACNKNLEYRRKPKPNLDADIASLQKKAKELGIKINILIE